MVDTPSSLAEPAPAADSAAAAGTGAGGLPLWAKLLIYVAVLAALGFAAQAWLP